jgi:hypothetical protein
MKVIEKLFVHYLQIRADDYMNKYLAGKSVLDITEDENTETMKEIMRARDCLGENYPISLIHATRFLSGKETKLTLTYNRRRIELNKARGDDYKLREQLSKFIELVNRGVVKSMSKYNTDRGRSNNADTEFDFGDTLQAD